jgi:hypothetical protein
MRGGGVGGGGGAPAGVGYGLDGAYDTTPTAGGNAGAGRTITADAGAVQIQSSAANNNNILELSKTPAGAQSGSGLSVTMGANATGAAIAITQSGSGNAITVGGDVGLARASAGVLVITDGTTGYGKLGLASSVTVSASSGTPEGSLTASVGSLYLRTNGGSGTSLYVKESGVGNTGWTAIAVSGGPWTRTGSTISPTTAGDTVSLSGGSRLDLSKTGGATLRYSGDTNIGWQATTISAVSAWQYVSNESSHVSLALGTQLVRLAADVPFQWSNTTLDPTTSADTQIKRVSAGVAGVYASGSTLGTLVAGSVSVGGSTNNNAGQLAWATGAANTQILGPTDKDLVVAANIAGAAANGRGIVVEGGAGGATSGDGGTATVRGGAADNGGAGGAGGGVAITGRNAAIAGAGGGVTVTCGNAVGASAGGSFSVTAGSGNTAGTITLTAGAGAGVGGGSITATGGSCSTNSTTAGAISLSGGAATGGTDVNGGTSTLAAGAGTGAGVAHVKLRSPFSGSSSSSAQAVGDRFIISGKRLALANNTATTFATVSCASGEMVSGMVILSIRASDGTDHQAASASFNFAVVNKAGALTTNVQAITDNILAKSAGASTLALTSGSTTSGNTIALQITANSSLAVTTLDVSYQIIVNGQAATVTPS